MVASFSWAYYLIIVLAEYKTFFLECIFQAPTLTRLISKINLSLWNHFWIKINVPSLFDPHPITHTHKGEDSNAIEVFSHLEFKIALPQHFQLRKTYHKKKIIIIGRLFWSNIWSWIKLTMSHYFYPCPKI